MILDNFVTPIVKYNMILVYIALIAIVIVGVIALTSKSSEEKRPREDDASAESMEQARRMAAFVLAKQAVQERVEEAAKGAAANKPPSPEKVAEVEKAAAIARGRAAMAKRKSGEVASPPPYAPGETPAGIPSDLQIRARPLPGSRAREGATGEDGARPPAEGTAGRQLFVKGGSQPKFQLRV